MARADFGILSPVIGKVGTVEGYMRRGKPILRKVKSLKKGYQPSEKQLQQRMKFRLVYEFTKEITEFVRVGFEFQTIGTTQTANNLAKSQQLRNAIQGEYPNLSIDHSKVLVSSGNLLMSKDIVLSTSKNEVLFSWSFDRITENPTDQVMLVIYPMGGLKPIYVVSGARRAEGKHSVEIPSFYKGAKAHTWISFISDNRKRITTSLYTGEILL